MDQRILLADDSLTIQKVVELTFMDEPFEVTVVGSGDDAIARLEDELPAIVVADVHMPGPSGYEVCRRAKELSPGLPVLLLVGTFEALDQDELAACGAEAHLKKPFDSQELLGTVQRLVAEAGESAPAADAEEADAEEESATGFETAAGLEPTAWEVPEETPVAPETAASTFETIADDVLEDVSDGSLGAGFDLGGDDGEDDGQDDEPTLDVQPGLDDSDEPGSVGDADPPSGEAGFDTVLLDEDALSSAVTAAAGMEPAEESTDDPIVEPAGEPSAEEDEPSVAAEAGSGHDGEIGSAAADGGAALSDEDVDRIARRVVELAGGDIVREVAWDVVPDMAEIAIKDRIRQLESEAE